MKRFISTSILAILIGLLTVHPLLAQEGQQSLETQVKELKTELESVNKKLDQVLKELAAIKAGQGANRQPPAPDTKVYDINISNSPFKGAADAPITIVEFSDFQCPFCVKEFPNIKNMMEQYPGKIKVVYKNFPLSFHKDARPAHVLAVLAFKQLGNEGFWKVHDLLVVDNFKDAIKIDNLKKIAGEIGVDVKMFEDTLADQAKSDELFKDDMTEAQKCGVRGTPTILINGLKLAQRTPEAYKARIDEILSGKKPEAAAKAPEAGTVQPTPQAR